MKLSDIVQAVAARLKELWPDRRVRVDEITQDADGCFFVRVTDSSQTDKLDRRKQRIVGMQVLYFRSDRDPLLYLDWAESMYDQFRRLDIDGHVVRVKNTQARQDDAGRFFQFVFDIDTVFVEANVQAARMESLDWIEGIKG